jgi:hypothetical protein
LFYVQLPAAADGMVCTVARRHFKRVARLCGGWVLCARIGFAWLHHEGIDEISIDVEVQDCPFKLVPSQASVPSMMLLPQVWVGGEADTVRVAQQTGFERERYIEAKIPDDFSRIVVICFFGDYRAEAILSSLILHSYIKKHLAKKFAAARM